MASLRTIFVAILLATAPPAYADPVDIWRPHIAEASSRFGIPEGWIIRVMRAESGGKTMRMLKVRTAADIDSASILRWLKATVAANG